MKKLLMVVFLFISTSVFADTGSVGSFHNQVGSELRFDDDISSINFTGISTIGLTTGSGADALPQAIIQVEDSKPVGTSGGTSIAGTNIRDLNNIFRDNRGFANLTGNKVEISVEDVTLFKYHACAPAFAPTLHKLFLRNVATNTLVRGSNSSNYTTGLTFAGKACVFGSFTTSGTNRFRLEHVISTGRATDGLGVSNASLGVPESFASICFEEVRQ